MHNEDIPLSTVLQVYRVKTIIMVPQTQFYHKKRHVKVYKQCLLKPFNQLSKKLNCFVIFHAWFPKKKWSAYIKSFHSMIQIIFLNLLNKNVTSKDGSSRYLTSHRTITKPR